MIIGLSVESARLKHRKSVRLEVPRDNLRVYCIERENVNFWK